MQVIGQVHGRAGNVQGTFISTCTTKIIHVSIRLQIQRTVNKRGRTLKSCFISITVEGSGTVVYFCRFSCAPFFTNYGDTTSISSKSHLAACGIDGIGLRTAVLPGIIDRNRHSSTTVDIDRSVFGQQGIAFISSIFVSSFIVTGTGHNRYRAACFYLQTAFCDLYGICIISNTLLSKSSLSSIKIGMCADT